MLETLTPVMFCLLLWWLGTGIILRLDSLPSHTFQQSRRYFTLLVVAVLSALLTMRTSTSLWAAYFGFAAAIVVWGWLEFLHYSGCLLGPRLLDCPPDLSSGKRFFMALQAMLYKELAVALVGVGLIALSWGSPNKTALYTYLVLWVMRLSAELNVFFGVGYLPEQWLPKNLQYLMTYRSKNKTNAFLPVSMILATMVCMWLFMQVPARSVDAFGHASILLTGTLLALAVVEHAMLIVPNKGAALWTWAQGGRAL